MIGKIKSIDILGRCFKTSTNLSLFPKESEGKSRDRISVVYGKNGSGKSTISEGIYATTIESEQSDIQVKFLDGNNNDIAISDVHNEIFVFNEQYIDANVKINDDGLGSIILLGGQVDVQLEIDAQTEIVADGKQKWQVALTDYELYEQTSNPLSPDFHLERIRNTLKKSGGWAEVDSKIKGNKQNSPVRDEVLFKICELKPNETLEELQSEFQQKKELLERVSETTIAYPALLKSEIKIDDAFENEVCKLLGEKIEQPKLTVREKDILKAVQNGRQKDIEEARSTFLDDNVEFCPYCYQAISEQYKANLIESINRVLNKDVETHKTALEGVVFPSINNEYGQYAGLDKELIQKIDDTIENCLKLIAQYQNHLKQKAENIYTPLEFKPNGLQKEIKKLNELLSTLERKISGFNNAISRRKKLIAELVEINKKVAHYQIKDLYRDYLKQNKEKQRKAKELEEYHTRYKNEEDKLKKLQLKKSNIGHAISSINNALEYVFFSKDRLSIELRGEKYYLKSKGNDVLPKNVSLGERNIVALCYFFTQIMANQEINKFYQKEAFIVIDDPVSSFDFENRVGILSYLRYQIDCVIKGNINSKVLILTHDLTTAFDLRKAMNEIAESTKGMAGILATTVAFQELKNNNMVLFKKERNEYKELLSSVYLFACETSNENPIVIGNTMRRVLEVFSTFNYRKSIEDISCDKNVLEALGEYSIYFNNLMYRLVLHGESHSAERIYSLRDDTNFYEFISEEEKQRTAKDILCFMYLLNPTHISSYLHDVSHAVENIEGWISSIKKDDSFIPKEKSIRRKVRLYDIALSAGRGNDIEEGEMGFIDYYTENERCDFALRVVGDSMEPEIPDKSIVLIKKCERLQNGHVGAFYYNGEIYCKRISNIEGNYYLESNNPKYSSIQLQPENVFKVYGEVVGVEKQDEAC